MKLKVKWAQRILAKEEAKKLTDVDEFKKQQTLLNNRKKELQGYAEQYVEEKREEFRAKTQPNFAAEEKVLTNWYGQHDTWEGSASLLQEHTPYRGPVVIEIKEIILDSLNLSEILSNITEFHEMENVKTYENFVEDIKTRSRSWSPYPKISWAYIIKVVGDDKVYWTYSWRESKLLKLNSKEAKYSVKAWKTEKKIEKLQKEKSILQKKAEVQIEKANHIKINFTAGFWHS